MTYTIVQPIENTNTSYKDTGRLSFYKYEDLQVLAELYAQANACIACDAKQEARGGLTQDGLYSTVWNYLGQYWGGQLFSESYLAPQKQYLDWDRITNLVDDAICPLPFLGNQINTSWLYVSSDPFDLYSPYMHQDNRLSACGTTAGTYALFGNGDADLKTQSVATQLGLNRPFTPKGWTDPRDILSAYQDAKTLSECDFKVLTWNSNMTGNHALGQAFDQTFVYTDIRRERRQDTKDYSGATSYSTWLVDSGWSNTPFSHREFWEKTAYGDGAHPDQYIYEWASEVDSLSFGTAGHPTLERNIPIPTNDFATNCLAGRKVLFVWEADLREIVRYNDTGLDHDTTTTGWYSFIADLTKYGTADFTDYLGNARGLCLKYTFPTTMFAQQHTSIKNLLNWSIPAFTQSWTPETSHYITTESRELNIYLRGCYSLQSSYLDEILTRP